MQIVVSNLLTNYKIFPSPKSKENILILHGWQNNLTIWEKTSYELSKSINVILVDLPGFGQTQIPPDSWDIFDYANFVETFIKKLSLDNLTIAGHSFGGRIALILGTKAKICKKVILIDSAGLPIKDFKSKFFLTAIGFGKPIIKILPKPLSKIIFDFVGSSDYKMAKELLPTFKKIVLTDLTEHAKKIKIPTLILWRDRDEILPITHAKKFKELIPHATLRIVWGAGHSPHTEKPEKFLEIVTEFLEQN